MRHKMAPFKLKFRMGGSSRSTSQEHDPDPQVSEALLGQHQLNATNTTGTPQQAQQHPTHSPLLGFGASTSTIDSTDCHSLGSVSTNERKSLLPAQHKTNTMRLGYLNQRSGNDSNPLGSQLPKTPPPSYEHVLEENTRLAHSFEYAQRQQLQQQHSQLSADAGSEPSAPHPANSRLGSAQNSRSSTLFTSLERLTLASGQCTDPDCRENFILLGTDQRRLRRQQEIDNEGDSSSGAVAETHNECTDRRCPTNLINNNNNEINNAVDNNEVAEGEEGHAEDSNIDDDNRKESIDSTELLLTRDNMSDYNDEENSGGGGGGSRTGDSNEACGGSSDTDDGLCHETNCPEDDHYNDGLRQQQNDSDNENAWNNQQQQQQQQQQQYYQQQQDTPEIISNKSSKEIYKDLAKQWGITCKMSDGCRCMDCQSNYFDCEFDDNEHQKTDGGLGAGTPMFISEVMHGSACTIL